MAVGWTKEKIIEGISSTIEKINTDSDDIQKQLEARCQQTLDYFQELLDQIPLSISGPLLSKTPKVIRKKINRITTIPENDIADTNNSSDESVLDQDTNAGGRLTRNKRKASKVAADNIKKQQSMSMNAKLRRPSDSDEELTHKTRRMHSKRLQESTSSVDESRPSKIIKLQKKSINGNERTSSISSQHKNSLIARNITKDLEDTDTESQLSNQNVKAKKWIELSSSDEEPHSKIKRKREEQASLSRKSFDETLQDDEPPMKKAHTNMTMKNESADTSMYEDAIEKPNILSSTMNSSALLKHKKMMNVTVVLENVQAQKSASNETFVVQKEVHSGGRSTSQSRAQKSTTPMCISSPELDDDTLMRPPDTSSENMDAITEAKLEMVHALLTDDESSPETKIPKSKLIAPKRHLRSSLLSDDDVVNDTPPKNVMRNQTSNKVKDAKNNYKSGALFSPYSKESVKKRVEAFEQAVSAIPQPAEVAGTMRVTRTKTRALAAANNANNTNTEALKDATQHLTFSMAKEIKQAKENEEPKENYDVDTIKKIHANEKLTLKMTQKITTPMGKSRLQMPSSVNRIPHTPLNSHPFNNPAKTLTASKINNLVTSVESFIPKSSSKLNSTGKGEEKRRKMDAEDARRKREEAIKIKTEEKKKIREMKELKNKKAREAKDRLDMEKRLKAEKEKEEKAKLAMQCQEKLREDAEKKRMLQLQRIQEKEEKRKQEEYLRQLRVQEQEEAERQLAEQKKLEQEAERRRLAEARAHHHAQLEAMRIQAQAHAKAKQQAQMNHKHQAPGNYLLDSDPDDEESDDESRPKYAVPEWAQSSVRQRQLLEQSYIDQSAVMKLFNTRRCTPDLTDLFRGISKNRLKRTSSAVWKTPPRYSMMTE